MGVPGAFGGTSLVAAAALVVAVATVLVALVGVEIVVPLVEVRIGALEALAYQMKKIRI
jgi:hypothetical protein